MVAAFGSPATGRWFTTPDGKRVDISRRGALRRIVATLAAHRVHDPGELRVSTSSSRSGGPTRSSCHTRRRIASMWP